jgi:hypothetical protein
MKLYSHAGAMPAPLPFRIYLADGRTRTNPSSFTAAEIADAGYVEAPEPPAFDPETEQLLWDGAWSVVPLPPPPVPDAVTPAQAKLALHAAGLLDAAEVAVATAGVEAQIYWTSALTFERQHPLILSIGAALGLTEAQIDDLFRDAATRG